MATLRTFAALLLVATLPVVPASAKTATTTISESAQIIPGDTVSVFAVNGTLVTVVQSDARSSLPPAIGYEPLVRIGFDLPAQWHFVRRVRWDKAHRTITIDF